MVVRERSRASIARFGVLTVAEADGRGDGKRKGSTSHRLLHLQS